MVTVLAQVMAIEPLAPNVARIRLRLPAGPAIARRAGQYLEVLDEDAAYAFSIASPPESGRDLELHVRHGTENPASLAVMALLRRQPEVRVRLPLGDCVLVAEPDMPLLFIAGATGFSQVKAFVEHAIACRWQVPIGIYWGARTPEELYQAGLAAGWARDHGNIRFVPVVSAAPPARGQRAGLVHEAVLADGHDLTAALAYVCGSPAMVYAVHDALVAQGMPANRVFSDVFAWAPRTAPPA